MKSKLMKPDGRTVEVNAKPIAAATQADRDAGVAARHAERLKQKAEQNGGGSAAKSKA